MLDGIITDARREARDLGIPWDQVSECARELKRLAIDKREAMDGARRCAWQAYCHYNGRSDGCHSFWRCGFEHVLGRIANSGRDYTAIRHYDEVAEAVAEQYSEWEGRGDELWEWLGTPYERLPSTGDFVAEALYHMTPKLEQTEDFEQEF